MIKQTCGAYLWPIEKAAAVAFSKVTGLSETDVISTCFRIGLAQVKRMSTVDVIRKEYFDRMAVGAAHQAVSDERGESGIYTLDHIASELNP